MVSKWINLFTIIGTIAGIINILLGIFITPDFVAIKMSPDGILESTTVNKINIVRVGAVIAGILIIIFSMATELLKSSLNWLPKRAPQTYKDKLKNSLLQRKHIAPPPTGFPVALAVAGLCIYIIIAILIAPVGHPEYHFASERGIITVLSAIFLAMAGSFAGICFLLRHNSNDWLQFFWLLTAIGFLFFSFDELMQFHEKLGGLIKRSSVGPTRTFRNWNDVIVIAYGVVAIPVVFYFLPEILRLPRVTEILVIAFSCYGIHTIIDSTQRRTSVSIILEESAKLFSSAFFAISMIFGILTIIASEFNQQDK